VSEATTSQTEATSMTTAARPLTAEQLMALPSGGWRYELVAGELKVMTPAGSRHGQIVMAIAALLGPHVRLHRLGVLFSPDTGFRLASDPDTVRAPDVAFVCAERIPESGVPDGYFPGAPDLAVEVVSPTDRLIEVEDKVTEYFAAGARLVWVVNPKHRRVTVHALGVPPRVLGPDDRLDGGDVVPGFDCAVREIFE
jgi:Uma2 family endonuclease